MAATDDREKVEEELRCTFPFLFKSLSDISLLAADNPPRISENVIISKGLMNDLRLYYSNQTESTFFNILKTTLPSSAASKLDAYTAKGFMNKFKSSLTTKLKTKRKGNKAIVQDFLNEEFQFDKKPTKTKDTPEKMELKQIIRDLERSRKQLSRETESLKGSVRELSHQNEALREVVV